MVMLILGGAGATLIRGGPLQPEEKLQSLFQHLAMNHLIDDVGCQAVNSHNDHTYVPPAFEAVRKEIQHQLERTRRHAHLLK